MKRLLINGYTAVIEEDTYFPFTYKLSDLEEINIINFPSTKAIMLPRGTQNDDIFGYIAEITRTNDRYSYSDNAVGVSFNQFKKGNYELFNNAELISKGIIRIVNITDSYYEIELYDKAIEMLEMFEDKSINDLQITDKTTNTPFNRRINYADVADMNAFDYGIMPVFGEYDTDYRTNSIFCSKNNGSEMSTEVCTLPTTMSPQQLRTFPASDVRYTIPLNDMFDLVEGKQIKFTSDVRALTANISMLLNKPTNKLETTETVIRTNTQSYPTQPGIDGRWTIFNYYFAKRPNNSDILFFNGNYMFKNYYNIVIKKDSMLGAGVITNYKGTNFTESTPDGTVIGELFVQSIVERVDTGYEYPPVESVILMIKGVNTFYNSVTGEITLVGSYLVNQDIYSKTKVGATMKVTNRLINFVVGDYKTAMFGLDTGFSVSYTISPVLIHKTLPFAEYDILTSAKILPKISIKDFIINIAKTFNLNIYVNNDDDKLYIDTKKYVLTSEIPIIDKDIDIDVTKVDFSRLKIVNGYPNSEHIEQYNDEFPNEWCSQVINTGYTIKREEKEVELPYSTSLAMIDYGYFAYDQFGAYLNGGYNRYPTGDTRGLDDGIILGYLQVNNERIFITDLEIVNGTRYIANNVLTYTPAALIPWEFGTSGAPGTAGIGKYRTFMPYRMVGGVIVESLEVNKPYYNFANLTDAEYPVESTLFHRFHRRMIIDKYDSDTHILTVKMLIDGLAGIDKVYNYKNSNYIIAELVEYDPTEPGLYEVKLMRVNDVANYTTAPPIPI